MRKIKKIAKAPSQYPRESATPATSGPDVHSLEKGILALLSFLGHSYKKGTISDELYRNERSAALRKLDDLRKIDSEEEAQDFDGSLDTTDRHSKLKKNKGDIESLLSFLEESYNEGAISEKSYRELKGENQKKLSRINKLLGNYRGEQVQLDAPDDLYGKFSDSLGEDEPEMGERDEAEGLPSSNEEKLEAPIPSFDAEPAVKPISFKEKLTQLTTRRADFPMDRDDPADEIMKSLSINPRKQVQRDTAPDPEVNSYRDADIAPGAASYREKISSKTSNMLGKIGGLIGKKAPDQKKEAAAEDASQAPAATAGGQPSWADKLPEEMNPQELAEYNKAMADRATEASGGDTKPEESAPIISSGGGGGGGGEESGISSAEINKIVLELEKLKVKVETVEGTRSVVEERIEHIMESIGELRTMLFEKESSGKEQEAKLDRFVEMVSDLEPQRFAKELDKRDKQLSEQAFRLEKLETITSDMSQNVGKVRVMLESIGSLKNIATISKDIADRSSKIDNTVAKVERLADETGRVYVELNRKLNEFTLYRGKQDILAESLKELVNMTESMSGKLDNFITREDMSDMKRGLDDTKLQLSELQTKIELASEGEDLPVHITDMQEEKEALEQILESNEEEFIEGQIKEAEYKKIKETHLRKLQALRSKLREELGKIMAERAQQAVRSTKIAAGVRSEGEAEASAEPPEGGTASEDAGEQVQEPQDVKEAAPTKSARQALGTKSAKASGADASASKSAPSRNAATTQKNASVPLSVGKQPVEMPEEEELEGEVDEQQIDQAEETAQLEDAAQEEEEGEETGDEEPSEEPAPAPMQELKKPAPLSNKGRKTAIALDAAAGSPMLASAPKSQGTAAPRQKLAAPAPALSLKTEKTLQSKRGGISDLIRNASEGKRALVNAKATTLKRGEQCLIKLEDDTGVIYAVFSSPLKGNVVVQGTIAKDPQGVPFVKILKATQQA